MALYEGYQGGFLSFIPQFFYYKLFYYPAYGHLWFLLYLFVFSMLCVPLFKRWQRDENRIGRIGAFFSQGHRLLLPIGALIVCELCLRPFFNITSKQMIVGDWANDAVYLCVFVYGYLFAADTRIQAKVRGYFKPSIVLGALSLAMLFYANFRWQVLGANEIYLTPIWAFAKGVYECSAIIFLVYTGKACLNKGGKAIGYLSKASFMIYIFHFLPVTFFTLFFINLKMPIFVKFLLVVSLSYLTVFLIYELWRRIAALKGRGTINM
jgi:glucan biosynthesis protein C